MTGGNADEDGDELVEADDEEDSEVDMIEFRDMIHCWRRESFSEIYCFASVGVNLVESRD